MPHKTRTPRRSIIGRIVSASRTLTLVLTLPILLSMLVMVTYAVRYNASLSTMETVAALKPQIDDAIAESLWSAVSGRKTFDECGVYDIIDGVNATLDAQIADVPSPDDLELTVARRTMDTVAAYVRQIETNMATGVPVATSEATLEIVRSVTALAKSILEDFLTAEIGRTALVTRQLRDFVTVAVLGEAAMILLSVVLTQRTAQRTRRIIREPIEHLEQMTAMLAEGNLRASIPPTDVVELERLTSSVGELGRRIEELLEQNRREQENLKKSELRLLQAQINPHFLYNTLEAIIWQSETGRSEDVIAIARALSDFFRISLSSGADWIPVSQEIRHLAGYLSIQKMRYRDILNYEIDVPEDMQGDYMLKLLLQPLVENALYHGIKNRRGGGRITVTGRREGDFLRFTVEDTGRGMSPERLDELRERLAREDTRRDFAPTGVSGGFSLVNVNQRIRLYYSQSDGLSIASGEGGTRVSFRVPAKTREEEQPHD